MKYLRWFGIVVGLSLLGYLCHQVGWTLVSQSLTWLGWNYLWVLLFPLVWDWANTVGFRKAFPAKHLRTSFTKLFMIRIVGETFNTLIPSGYTGGEPLKARFLAADMPVHEATSSVLIAKVAQSLSLVFYLIFGLTLALPGKPSPLRNRAELTGISLMALGIGLFTLFIARGSFTYWATKLYRWTKHPWLKRQEKRFLDLDESLRDFFKNERRRFIESFLWHGVGWMLSAVEVCLIFYFLGTPIPWREGWFIGAFTQLGVSVAVAIPGGIGFFEGAHYLAATLLGLPPSLGLSVGLIRRVRELFWHAMGVALFWDLSKRFAKAHDRITYNNETKMEPSQ